MPINKPLINTNCRICYGPLDPFIDLGKTPLADAFITSSKNEKSYPLRASVCRHCKLVQLAYDVEKSLLFNDDYGFFTSASPSSITYFRRYAKSVMEEYPSEGLHVEIASNDGTLLKHFVDKGKNVLGIDPSGNTTKLANENGVRSVTEHFDNTTAIKISKEYGKASVIIANNVVAHVEDVHGFMEGVYHLLSPSGVFIAEVQYLPHLLFNNAFDHIYHEHRSFFSFEPLQKLLSLHGLKVIDVKMADTQGGSIRIYAVKDIFTKVTSRVLDLMNYETRMKLDDIDTYKGFQPRIDYTKEKLITMLAQLKAEGKTVYGFGASAKGNTLLNYCGIDTTLLDCIVDLTPYKIGKLSPGTHIPVKHPDEVKPPDYYLVLVWNYLPGILERNKEFLDLGGHFIIPIPTPFIL